MGLLRDGFCVSAVIITVSCSAEFVGILYFLADRTNGCAIGTVLRLSSVRPSVCDVMYCG